MKRILALLVVLATAAVAGEPKVLADDWYVVRLFGQDAGSLHTRAVRDGDVVEVAADTLVVMKRGGMELKVTQAVETRERADGGALLTMHSSQKMSEMGSEVSIRFEGAEAKIATTVGGTTRESMQKCGTGIVGPYRIEQLTGEPPLKEGTRVETRTYVPELGGATDLVITVGGKEEVELLDGKKETLTRVDTHFPKLGLTQETWCDDAGKARKFRVAVAGMVQEFFLADEARARKAAGATPAELPDSFTKTLLAPLHPIPDPRAVDRAVYRVRSKGEMPDFADSRQKVEQEGDGAVLLTIERKVPPDGAGTRPIADAPKDLAPCLAASSLVQSDAPEIGKVAKEVVGDETDAWRAARKLEHWVHDNVTEKSMDVGFASALEVCRNRKGDCTEHAVFLCGLCRAAGIPSRVVMGLTCIGNAFGGHAWTEVWIGGDWYPLDGTLGLGSVDATHITLTRMTLEDAAGPDAYVGLLKGLGNLEIDPQELVEDGQTLRPADEAGKTEGNRFESRLFSIAFDIPEGFTLREPGSDAGFLAPVAVLGGAASSGRPCLLAIYSTEDGVWDLVHADPKCASFKDGTVDGNPSFSGMRDKSLRTYVRTGHGLFLFLMNPAEDDADRAVFEKFLASVDLAAGR
jgi:transglutaminase-like putative cysteine protease